MRNTKLALVGMVVMFLFSGCSKSESNNDNAQGEGQVSFPSEYNREEQNVSFSCEVLAPASPVLTVSTAKKANVSSLELGNSLLEDKQIEYSTIWDDSGTDTKYDGKKELTSEDIENGMEVMYYISNNSLVNIGENRITYFNNWNSVTQSLNLGEEDEGYNGELFKQDKTFDFITQSQAVEDMESIIHTYTDIDRTLETVYTVDADTLNANVQISDFGETIEFTHEDDGYYICMRQELQGLPVHAQDVANFHEYAGDAPLIGYYTESGWRELIVDGSLLYTFQTTDEPVYLKKFEEIADNVSNYYNTLITDNTYEVYRATLYNYVSKDRTVTPVWIFKVYEKYPDGNVRCDQLDINAVTGEVFTVYD